MPIGPIPADIEFAIKARDPIISIGIKVCKIMDTVKKYRRVKLKDLNSPLARSNIVRVNKFEVKPYKILLMTKTVPIRFPRIESFKPLRSA